MATYPIPEGYSTVCPYLVCDHAADVLDFMIQTFGAQERGIMKTPNGKIAHGEVKIGDTVIMISDGSPEWPKTPSLVHVYVEDADAVFKKALASGGTMVRDMETFFYGDRSGGVKDPGGNTWWISSRVEDVSPEETARRMKEHQANKSAQ